MNLPNKTFLVVVRIMVITIVTAIGVMGIASASTTYIRNSIRAQTAPKRALVHQSNSWLSSSTKTSPAVSSAFNQARPVPKDNPFSRSPLGLIGGVQPQQALTAIPEPTEVALAETSEPIEQVELIGRLEINDHQPELQVRRTPVVDEDPEMTSRSSVDQDENMPGTPSFEQDDEISSSDSADRESPQHNNQSHNQSSHSDQHRDGNHHNGGGHGGD